jgi:hypothetical protein
MLTRRQALVSTVAVTGLVSGVRAKTDERVRVARVPEQGIQPQAAMDRTGTLHLLYYFGDAGHGDLFYTRSRDGGVTFSSPLRVNSQQGSAIATGTIRGGQLALGRQGRAHVAWNGSGQAEPRGPVNPDSGKAGEPMLYARLSDRRDAFEPQRNLMHNSFGLDGGGSLAADDAGNVYVGWHGVGEAESRPPGKEGEARRRVWIAHSSNDGLSFSGEAKAWSEDTGACGCCGMKLFADSEGDILALYRSATESIHRDIYLLDSKDHGYSFQGKLLHKWDINACPMSSMDFAEGSGILACAWETGGQVFWTRVRDPGEQPIPPISAPGDGKGRKHPRLAVNRKGEVLLVWTEGTGWQKGGGVAWQLYESTGNPVGETQRVPNIPVWSFAAVVSRPNNGFTIVY